MGHIYDAHGQLCCDLCGGSPARTVPCPFHWCQGIDACARCRQFPAVVHIDGGAACDVFSPKAHRAHGCEANHARFEADRQAEAAILTSGGLYRVAATSTEGGAVVRVTFRGAAGHYLADMAAATYRAVPLGAVAQPLDFAQHGPVWPVGREGTR